MCEEAVVEQYGIVKTLMCVVVLVAVPMSEL